MTLLSVRREVGEFRKRYKWMALVVIAVFCVLWGRAVQLQVVRYEHFAAVAKENITKTITFPASRGLIRDHKGRVVASNRPSYKVYITPQLLDPDHDLPRFAELMGLDDEGLKALKARIDAIPARRRTHQIEMFSEIDRDQVAALETHRNELPAVDVVAVPARTYPYGTLAAHAIGYLNEVNAEDIEKHPEMGYRAGERIGRTGIERALERELRGERGYKRVVVDARGRRVERAAKSLGHTGSRKDPESGLEVRLTLDLELTKSIQRAFRGHPAGSAVVVDVKTGAVRALYSKPAYDLNELASGLSVKDYAELRDDPFRPLIDKTIYESYFPGSTYKPITALAALKDGIEAAVPRVECPGYYQIGRERKRCTSPHGEVDLHSAIVQSCNVYFWELAQHVGLERLNAMGRLFGFGDRTGVGINSEAKGFLPTRKWYAERFGRFRIGYTLDAAIGQGNTRTTLLQLALAYGALANHGILYEPQIVESLSTPEGQLVSEFTPKVKRRIDMKESHWNLLHDAMVGVVAHRDGTAHEARIEGGVSVAGKTGTAEVGRQRLPGIDPRRAWYFNRSHAWFAGYAPAEDPEIAVVVLVEHGGPGGKYAAPIAMEVIEGYLGVPESQQSSSPQLSTPARIRGRGGRAPSPNAHARRNVQGGGASKPSTAQPVAPANTAPSKAEGKR